MLHDMNWRRVHRRLGCFGCKFADKSELGRGACCNRPGGCTASDGVCQDRQPYRISQKSA